VRRSAELRLSPLALARCVARTVESTAYGYAIVGANSQPSEAASASFAGPAVAGSNDVVAAIRRAKSWRSARVLTPTGRLESRQ
jgi:hypothetical protein